MSYRPICDVWILARSKVKYYGAYPAGFLHRARAVLGVGPNDPVLHVCGGKVREYPYKGLGRFDKTLDLDPETQPDYLRDARESFPFRLLPGYTPDTTIGYEPWSGVLIDRPYTDEDAERYKPGKGVLPTANQLVKNGIAAVPVGGRVGILDYVWPQPPKNATEVAVIAVGTGRNNRARWFTVFERTA